MLCFYRAAKMSTSPKCPGAYHKEPLLKLLSQLNVPQWNPPSGSSSLVSSVVFFRHGARTPVFHSELLPPVSTVHSFVLKLYLRVGTHMLY